MNSGFIGCWGRVSGATSMLAGLSPLWLSGLWVTRDTLRISILIPWHAGFSFSSIQKGVTAQKKSCSERQTETETKRQRRRGRDGEGDREKERQRGREAKNQRDRTRETEGQRCRPMRASHCPDAGGATPLTSRGGGSSQQGLPCCKWLPLSFCFVMIKNACRRRGPGVEPG